MPGRFTATAVLVVVSMMVSPGSPAAARRQQPVFGGGYAALDARRQHLIDDWVGRFVKTTGQSIAPAPFYDEFVSLSTRTTFEAVTHALMTTKLTDATGTPLGDALGLVEQLETVHGQVEGARGDAQFRIYARVPATALDTLSRTREFKRGSDNSVYHAGYPINYRQQSGVPSIQFSLAPDGRRADIDVDYRGSSFPAALFNGHLTASNSDVRAGNNYDRHLNRWAGFQNWWRSFFGVKTEHMPEVTESTRATGLSRTPRIGKKTVPAMTQDFLTAWLVEGNAVAALSYVSDRSYACMAQDADNPAGFDRGLAPFQLLMQLKAAHDALGSHDSLAGLVVGTRLSRQGLRVVDQPNHAQFVVYDVPDDIAASLDCERSLTPGMGGKASRKYGNYFGSTFYVTGNTATPMALLWGKQNGYWKIVSWHMEGEEPATLAASPAAPVPAAHVAADSALARAAQDFLEAWLVRKNYDAAFAYLSPKAYACYNLERGDQPAAPSPEEAGRRLRAGLAAAGRMAGTSGRLSSIIQPVEPVHPLVRVMDHQAAGSFTITSLPDALGDAAECQARADGTVPPQPLPLDYGRAFGMNLRFRTMAGETPVLRLLWRKEPEGWRITSYAVEVS